MQTVALGIDIGGTNTSFGLVDKEGSIVARGHMSTRSHPDFDTYLVALVKALQPLLKPNSEYTIAGVGVGAPNSNYYTGEIDRAPNLPWPGVIPFAKILQDKISLPVTITNDANAATIGEMIYGSAKDLQDFIVITLGTGLGSGVVANGKLVYGHDGFAGEIGHMIAIPGGRDCGCGRKGCLERYASATGIVLTANEWLRERREESILHHETRLTAWSIHTAALKGDKLALELFDYTAKILGETLANAAVVTSPKAFILFGGLAQAGDLLMIPTKKYMEANMLQILKDKVQILSSSLPDADAAILGASALVWK